MKARLLDKKAISPVIATVILVSVTIVVAVAVAYWMSGIAGIYTRVERIGIVSHYANKLSGSWEIVIDLKNSGSADATIIHVLLNGKTLGTDGVPDPTSTYYYKGGTDLPAEGLTIQAGQSGSVTVTLDFFDDTLAPNNPEPGTSIEIKLHTAANMDYPVVEMLP